MEALIVGASFISCRGSCHCINILQVKLIIFLKNNIFCRQFDIVSRLVHASSASELRARVLYQMRPPSK